MRLVISVLLFVVGWALTPVFVRYMSNAYDPYTQAFIRYAAAALTLMPYSLVLYRKELIEALQKWRTLLPM